MKKFSEMTLEELDAMLDKAIKRGNTTLQIRLAEEIASREETK